MLAFSAYLLPLLGLISGLTVLLLATSIGERVSEVSLILLLMAAFFLPLYPLSVLPNALLQGQVKGGALPIGDWRRGPAFKAALVFPLMSSPDPSGTRSGETPLGRALEIRSMDTVAGDFLPFAWPMRNFIHHNSLHGLEHLPFEEAFERATALSPRARVSAPRRVSGPAARGIHRSGGDRGADGGTPARPSAGSAPPDRIDEDCAALNLHRILITLIARMDQPSVGNAFPSTDAILAQLRPLAEAR